MPSRIEVIRSLRKAINVPQVRGRGLAQEGYLNLGELTRILSELVALIEIRRVSRERAENAD